MDTPTDCTDPAPPRPASKDNPASAAPLTVPSLPVCGAREEGVCRRLAKAAELLARAQQRQIRLEMSASRIRLARARRSAERDARHAGDADAEERAWLRAEARSMLDAGWTPQELREIGFADWISHRE